MSADGKITSATREPPRFTSRADRHHMDMLRASSDAVLMGAQTLRDDDPHFIVRSPAALAERRQGPKGPEQPWSIVLSTNCALPLTRRFFTDPDVRRLVVTGTAATAAAVARLAPHCEVWRLGKPRVGIAALLGRLAQAGVQRLLVEGGAQVAYEFLQAACVDELYLTVAPILLGGAAAPGPVGGPGWTIKTGKKLDLAAARTVGDEVFCHYRLRAVGPEKAATRYHPAGA